MIKKYNPEEDCCMLHFILGAAGTGKTTLLLDKIELAARSGGRPILLVPEQYSFEGERLVYRRLGPKRALGVEVYSFTRLCDYIFRSCGGMAGTAINATAKYLLMSIAVSEIQDRLELYRKSCNNTSFLETLVETMTEFKTAGISPTDLAEFAQSCEKQPLRDKTRELSLLYGAYQGLIDRGYTDPDDALVRACARLRDKGGVLFGDATVFVDGFYTFSAAEYALLEQVMAGARDTYVAMTSDSQHDREGGLGLFSPVKATLRRLRRLAGAAGVKLAVPQVLDIPRRFAAEELGVLAQSYLQPEAEPYLKLMTRSLRLYGAGDLYGEAEYVAAQIARLVREEGCRYRDIAVVARDTEPYLCAVETMFHRYDVPFFSDRREDVELNPLASCLLAAVDAVRSSFGTESVLGFAKSPAAGLALTDVCALENYCYTWGVRGQVWLDDFGNNPRGLAGPLTQEDREALSAINATRAAVVAPLLTLREGLKDPDGRKFAGAAYDFLTQLDAAGNLAAYAQSLDVAGQAAFLDATAQLWDILMEILDVFGAVLGGVRMPAARLCELLRLAVGTADTGAVPQTLDSVLVGRADRIRPGDVKAVFVLGANEGVFPAEVSAAGVFTDNERQELIDTGLEVSPPSLQRAVLEKFYSYYALTLSSHRLFVTWSRSDLAGRELQPSVIVTQLREIFPLLGLDTLEDREHLRLAGERAAFALLSERFTSDTPETAALLRHFSGKRDAAVARMERAATRPAHRLMDAGRARSLFGGRLRLSPSRVERYYRCPFSYFASYGLGLKKRSRAEFSPLESGSVIHSVLQVMVQRHGGRGLLEVEEARMTAEVEQIIQEYIAERVERTDTLPVRFHYLFSRLTGMLVRLLRRLGEEFAQSEFQPAYFELAIAGGEAVEPLRLRTADGVPVVVEGVVDRVDLMEKNGRKYLRVVDYKSGRKNFELGEVLMGLNLQMLLYLFTIGENGRDDLRDAIPAGVLYMPVRESFVSLSRDAGPQQAAEALRKEWRMSGLLLEDEEALRGMEAEVSGVYIPVKKDKKGGFDARSSLADMAGMGRVAAKVKGLVVQMAAALGDGKIGAFPTDSDGQSACAWCDYRAVCGFEEGDAVKTVEKIDRKTFFTLLEEEDNG